MGLALRNDWREFLLHIRCTNCNRQSIQGVSVPADEGCPEDVNDLIHSAALQNTPYRCLHCDSAIGQLIGVSEGGRTCAC